MADTPTPRPTMHGPAMSKGEGSYPQLRRLVSATISRAEQAEAQAAALREALTWAERNLTALVTDDEGNGAFIRGTATEIAGFGVGMKRIRAALHAQPEATAATERPDLVAAPMPASAWEGSAWGEPQPLPAPPAGTASDLLTALRSLSAQWRARDNHRASTGIADVESLRAGAARAERQCADDLDALLTAAAGRERQG